MIPNVRVSDLSDGNENCYNRGSWADFQPWSPQGLMKRHREVLGHMKAKIN